MSVFLCHKARNFLAVAGDCRLAAPADFCRDISAEGLVGLARNFEKKTNKSLFKAYSVHKSKITNSK